jgi:hypothetical protein
MENGALFNKILRINNLSEFHERRTQLMTLRNLHINEEIFYQINAFMIASFTKRLTAVSN